MSDTQLRYSYGAFHEHALNCPQCRKWVADTLRLATEGKQSVPDFRLFGGKTHQPCEEGRRLLDTIFR